ncbi:MAG: hypothetical protein QXL06_01840 [Nitrososphaerota archaeon]
MFEVDFVSFEWSDYGFQEIYLKFNGKPIPWKAIVRDNTLVNITSRQYRLLPNEVALAAADEAAAEIGAVKIADYLDPTGRLYVLYDIKSDVEIIKNVKSKLGIYVYNSVDGSLAFGASILNILEKNSKRFYSFMPPHFMTTFLSPEAAIAIVRKMHRMSLDVEVEKISTKLKALVDRAIEAAEIFRLWSEIKIDEEISKVLLGRLPQVYLPHYIKAMSEGVTLTELLTVWDAYVDISENIWTSSSGKKASIDRKFELYRMLYNALPKP